MNPMRTEKNPITDHSLSETTPDSDFSIPVHCTETQAQNLIKTANSFNIPVQELASTIFRRAIDALDPNLNPSPTNDIPQLHTNSET
jgi:hypothetical protein